MLKHAGGNGCISHAPDISSFLDVFIRVVFFNELQRSSLISGTIDQQFDSIDKLHYDATDDFAEKGVSTLTINKIAGKQSEVAMFNQLSFHFTSLRSE